MAAGGSIILSYHDSLLRESDLKLLSGPHWLNDNLIGFWFQYLEHDLYRENASQIGFISPEVTQFIKLGVTEDLENTFKSLNIKNKELLFLPINDCSLQDSPGGSHWSLLVYRASFHIFEHYDSHTGSVNRYHAENVAKILTPFLLEKGTEAEVFEMECTQQQNGFDCGLHVICNTEALCRKQFANNPKHVSDIASPESVRRARSDLRNIIYSLKKK